MLNSFVSDDHKSPFKIVKHINFQFSIVFPFDRLYWEYARN